jgi:hydrogenase nickel incorporation protein HypB
MHEVGDEHTMQNILYRNDDIADHNREHFDAAKVFAINLMSAPGAGKTTLLAASIPRIGTEKCSVIEGDMVGELDVDRLVEKGIRATQISTGKSCHLSAQMVARILHDESILKGYEYLFLENVGNLVCPAEFLLGEHKRVVLLSVTEGADKPLKYPVIFRNCDAVIFTKSDLLPYVDFDLEEAASFVHCINPSARIFSTSTKTGEGMTDWVQWLQEQREAYIQELKEHGHVHIHSR